MERGRDSHRRMALEQLNGEEQSPRADAGRQPRPTSEHSRDSHIRRTYERLTNGPPPSAARSRETDIRDTYEQLTGGDRLTVTEARGQLNPHPRPRRDRYITEAYDRLIADEHSSQAEANHQVRPPHSQQNTGSRHTGRPAYQGPTLPATTYTPASQGPTLPATTYTPTPIFGPRRDEQHTPLYTEAERTRHQQNSNQRPQPGSSHQLSRSHSTSSHHPQHTQTTHRGDPRPYNHNNTNSTSRHIQRSASTSHPTNQTPRGRQNQSQALVAPNRPNQNPSPDRYFTVAGLSGQPTTRPPPPARPQTGSQATTVGRTTITMTQTITYSTTLEITQRRRREGDH